MEGSSAIGADVPDMADHVVIVTGANSGVGFQTTKIFVHAHAHVVLACRSQARAQDAMAIIRQEVDADARLDFIPLDLMDIASVHAFAESFKAKYNRLDVLVNNGGVLLPTTKFTQDGWEMHFAVNYLGHFELTNELFDMLVRSPGTSRIVSVSSLIHHAASLDLDTVIWSRPNKWMYVNEYSVSKLAALLFTYELDRRIRRYGLEEKVMAVAAHPGVTNTELIPKLIASVVGEFCVPIVETILNWVPICQEAEKAALPIVYAATHASVASGDYYGPNGFGGIHGDGVKKEESSAASHNEQDAIRLWEVSEDALMHEFKI